MSKLVIPGVIAQSGNGGGGGGGTGDYVPEITTNQFVMDPTNVVPIPVVDDLKDNGQYFITLDLSSLSPDMGMTYSLSVLNQGITVQIISVAGTGISFRRIFENNTWTEWENITDVTIKASLDEVEGYDSSKNQVLKNSSGNLEWSEDSGGGTVDQTYDATSTNAQSGTAVAGALTPYLKNQATTQTGSDASLILFPWNEYSIAAKGSVFIGPNNGTIVTQGNHDTLVGAGPSANAANGDCTAVGYNARASGQGSTSIGSGAASIGQYGIAMGKDSTCNESGSIAIGQNSYISGGNNAIAIGNGAKTDQSGSYIGSYRIAIGAYAYSTAYNAIAIGCGGTNNTSAKATNRDSIQLGTGVNSTAKTLQVYEWPLLDGNTGKIYSDRLPSGGGAPTITWYTNQTGDTITIPDTTGASLVKVYKNGELLQPGVATTNYNFTGGSNNNEWINLTNAYQTSSANSWYYQARFQLPASRSDIGGEGSFFAFTGEGCAGPCLTYYNYSNSNLRFLVSSDGTSWDVGIQQVSYVLDAWGQDVDLRFGFEEYPDARYYFAIKMPYEKEYVVKYNWTKSTKALVTQPIQLLNLGDGAYNVNWNKSKLYMKTLKVVVDNEIKFDGRNAVLGTDYINNNCTAETVSTCTNDYCISGTTLTLSEDLIDTDKIAVEIY